MESLPKNSKITESGREMSKFREYELWYFNLVYSYIYHWLVLSHDLFQSRYCFTGKASFTLELLSEPPCRGSTLSGRGFHWELYSCQKCSPSPGILEDFEGERKTEPIPKFFHLLSQGVRFRDCCPFVSKQIVLLEDDWSSEIYCQPDAYFWLNQ